MRSLCLRESGAVTRGGFAVVVLSCDKYADLWAPFMRQFRRYFPRGDWPIYVGSNLEACKEQGVTPILSGPDLDWSTSCKKILRQIPEDKIFLILEDLFLDRPVDEELFRRSLDLLRSRDAVHIKYWGVPAPDRPSGFPEIGVYDRGAPYRATVCGFWDRKCLISLLLDGESPWNFEILGSYRTSYSDGFYGVTRPLCTCSNMVEKGKWIPQSVEWARGEGIAIELERRPMLVGGNRAISRMKMLYFRVMVRLPWRVRVAIMNKLRLALISY
jgi:hypothetical protein